MNAVKLIEHARRSRSAPDRSRAALERLRAATMRADARLGATTERSGPPLHPVSAQVIRQCVTLIELCWAVRSDERRDDVIDRMRRMVDIMQRQAASFRHGDAERSGYAGDPAE